MDPRERWLDRFASSDARAVTSPRRPHPATSCPVAGRGVPRRPHPAAAYPVASRGVKSWDYTYIVPAGDAWPLGPEFRRGRPDRGDPSYR